MRFTWDESKRLETLRVRGLDFANAPIVFAGSTFSFEDDREDYGEQRWVTLGLLGPQVVVLVHTESESEIHIISMRKAVRHEQILYFHNT